MATVSKWNPFGVSLDLEATAGTVTRISATKFTVVINASWETYWSGSETTYGMDVSSGGTTITLNKFTGGYHTSGSGSLTGVYTISGNGSAVQTIAVTFRNYNNDNGNSSTKDIILSVTVPAWTSYTVSYNANGGSGAPGAQTKWKDQTLTLSGTKPTRTGHSFQGWATSASGGVAYASGAKYTGNASITLYAVWKANTYTVRYNANGGSGAPDSQTKTYGVALTLSSTKPTRTNYTFKGWGTSASATTVSYNPGGSYTTNAAITLYAIWELNYIKPRITGFSVTRCDSSGNAQTDGTYALVKFSWACDRTISSITIHWKLVTASSYGSSTTVSASGTSGSVSKVVNGSFATSSSYNIRATVTDSIDSTQFVGTLSSMMFSIHAKPGGGGIAFGKMHEHNGYVEFGWDINLYDHDIWKNGNYAYAPYGFGLGRSSISVSDLNTCLKNGWYWASADTANVPSVLTYCAVHVRTRLDGQIVQTLFGMNLNRGCQMQRHTLDGGETWIEEWINPPMHVNELYKTTERWNGKPVYITLINCNALPSSGSKNVTTKIPSSAQIIYTCGIADVPGGVSEPLPMISHNGAVLCSYFLTASKNVSINVHSDLSNYNARIIVKYTID